MAVAENLAEMASTGIVIQLHHCLQKRVVRLGREKKSKGVPAPSPFLMKLPPLAALPSMAPDERRGILGVNYAGRRHLKNPANDNLRKDEYSAILFDIQGLAVA